MSFISKIIAFFQSIWLFLAGLFHFAPAKPSDPAVIPPPENPQVLRLDEFSLVWNDEFDGNALDASKWTGFRCGGTSRVPEYLLLTAEVGGSDGVAGTSWAGDALKADAQPTDFVVDYVRVYQYRSLLG